MAYEFYSNTYDGRKLCLRLIQNKGNAIDNKSVITWELVTEGGVSAFYTVNATRIVINGVTVYSKDTTYASDKVFPARAGSVSGSLVVNHNFDGTKSILVGFYTSIGEGIPSQNYGGDVTLSPIERKAVITKVSRFDDVTMPTISFDNPIEGIPATLTSYISLDGSAETIRPREIPSGSNTLEFLLSEYELNLFRNATPTKSRTVYFVMRTDLGDDYFIDVMPVPFSVTPSEDTNPEMQVYISPNNGNLPSSFYDVYIQGKSKINVIMDGLCKYGATASQYRATIEDTEYREYMFVSEYLKNANNQLGFTCSMMDSRGFTVDVNKTISVLEYAKPTIRNAVVYRSDSSGNENPNGDNIYVSATRIYSKVISGTQRNHATLRYRYKTTESNVWSAWNTLIASSDTSSDSYNSVLPITFSKLNAYNIEINVIDTLYEQTSLVFDIPSSSTTLHLGAGGKAVGIGGFADTDTPESITLYWTTIIKESLKRGDCKLNFGSDISNLPNIPSGVTGGVYVHLSSNSINYYLLISSNGNFYVGVGSSEVTWTQK